MLPLELSNILLLQGQIQSRHNVNFPTIPLPIVNRFADGYMVIYLFTFEIFHNTHITTTSFLIITIFQIEDKKKRKFVGDITSIVKRNRGSIWGITIV